MKALFALPLALFVLAFAGCGETTTVVSPTGEKKVTVKDDKIETKEKTVRDNPDGTQTKTETKTETK
jgi:uncharacterized OsmC-like protein